jgi:hypothetical protein
VVNHSAEGRAAGHLPKAEGAFLSLFLCLQLSAAGLTAICHILIVKNLQKV